MNVKVITSTLRKLHIKYTHDLFMLYNFKPSMRKFRNTENKSKKKKKKSFKSMRISTTTIKYK